MSEYTILNPEYIMVYNGKPYNIVNLEKALDLFQVKITKEVSHSDSPYDYCWNVTILGKPYKCYSGEYTLEEVNKDIKSYFILNNTYKNCKWYKQSVKN
jgi:hypothetical protein